MTTELAGQVVLVVGGTRGIGAAIARDFASAGSEIVIAGRDMEAGEAAAAEIVGAGGRAAALRCDVTSESDCVALLSVIAERFGRLDTLFANQGVAGPVKGLTDWPESDVTRCLDVNLVGCLHLARAAEDLLAADGGGRFIVTGSASGSQNIPGLGMYGISKAAVSHLVRQLAVEWRQKSIAVNELVPGPVRTALTGFPDESPTAEGAEPNFFEEFSKQNGEWLKNPEEVVPLARLLATLPTNGTSGQALNLAGRVI